MKPELEQRSYSFEVRAEESEVGSIITGRPIVYESATDMGYFTEIIERGALDNANLTDVRFLVNHDVSRIPLARSRRNNGNSTMQMIVDDSGMNIRVKLDTENNAEARALYSAVQRGDISGMSFMFSIEREEWADIESEHPVRRIKEIGSVVEVSAVTFPAYDATEIQARGKAALEKARQAVETAREQRAESVETDANQIAILKAKIQILTEV
ncbi:MAG: HK97 family phage prohead protease [Oscillospiraceae bacterium]|nr:HK97 family phage prohead protease [Bacteroidaceae bacterium]MBP0988808.1 HK97 family phage prohead protease [Oscillospiraceae bacterium]